MSGNEKARPVGANRRPRQTVTFRKAPRRSYHIRGADVLAVLMGALLALSVLLASAGIYRVGYDNGLKAQGVEHAQR